MLRELGRVPVRKEVPVDLLELLDGEVAGGAVLQEPLVPLLDLGVGELGVLAEVLQDLGLELAVLFPHGGRDGGCGLSVRRTVSF